VHLLAGHLASVAREEVRCNCRGNDDRVVALGELGGRVVVQAGGGEGAVLEVDELVRLPLGREVPVSVRRVPGPQSIRNVDRPTVTVLPGGTIGGPSMIFENRSNSPQKKDPTMLISVGPAGAAGAS
jgi:hypothetical protein